MAVWDSVGSATDARGISDVLAEHVPRKPIVNRVSELVLCGMNGIPVAREHPATGGKGAGKKRMRTVELERTRPVSRTMFQQHTRTSRAATLSVGGTHALVNIIIHFGDVDKCADKLAEIVFANRDLVLGGAVDP